MQFSFNLDGVQKKVIDKCNVVILSVSESIKEQYLGINSYYVKCPFSDIVPRGALILLANLLKPRGMQKNEVGNKMKRLAQQKQRQTVV